MIPPDIKYRIVHPLETFVVNPPVRLAWKLGAGPPGDAQLETTGRHTGRPHLTPICDGLVGETFWLIAQHGRRSDYVQNIQAHPRVRVRSGSRSGWREGTAHVLASDDPHERIRMLSRSGDGWRSLCLKASAAMSSSPLTIRIDLDPR